MKTIQFNPYINKIGLEIEGFWSDPYVFRNSLLIKDIGSDASLNDGPLDKPSAELRTVAMNEDETNQVLRGMDKLLKEDKYALNYSVGLHYHISLKKQYYGLLVNKQFYDQYVKMFKENFVVVYDDRHDNKYCKADLRKLYYERGDDSVLNFKRHFRTQSADKYAFINYQYRSFTTIEFRAYGGKFATFEGLSECIGKTIDLIGSFIQKNNKLKLIHSISCNLERSLPPISPRQLLVTIPPIRHEERLVGDWYFAKNWWENGNEQYWERNNMSDRVFAQRQNSYYNWSTVPFRQNRLVNANEDTGITSAAAEGVAYSQEATSQNIGVGTLTFEELHHRVTRSIIDDGSGITQADLNSLESQLTPVSDLVSPARLDDADDDNINF